MRNFRQTLCCSLVEWSFSRCRAVEQSYCKIWCVHPPSVSLCVLYKYVCIRACSICVYVCDVLIHSLILGAKRGLWLPVLRGFREPESAGASVCECERRQPVALRNVKLNGAWWNSLNSFPILLSLSLFALLSWSKPLNLPEHNYFISFCSEQKVLYEVRNEGDMKIRLEFWWGKNQVLEYLENSPFFD